MISLLCYKKACTLCVLCLLLFLCQTGDSLATDKDVPQSEGFSVIDFKNGLLKVSVKEQRFTEVMNEISKKAEMEIIINYPADEKLTIGFDYLPLEKGLKNSKKEKLRLH